MKKKNFKLVLSDIKDADGWQELIQHFNLDEETVKRYFEYGEYASIEIWVNENLGIENGTILPIK